MFRKGARRWILHACSLAPIKARVALFLYKSGEPPARPPKLRHIDRRGALYVLLLCADAATKSKRNIWRRRIALLSEFNLERRWRSYWLVSAQYYCRSKIIQ